MARKVGVGYSRFKPFLGNIVADGTSSPKPKAETPKVEELKRGPGRPKGK